MWHTIQHDVIHCCVMQSPEIFTGDVGRERNDRLVMVHTSDHRRSKLSGFTSSSEVLGCLLRMKNNMMTKNSKISCEEAKVCMYP